MISPSNKAGFTLLEMLVVIAVMGVALILITGYGQPHSRRLEIQAAARQVAMAMRNARGLAITRGEPVALVMPHLPPWLQVTVEAPAGGIVFAPDGSASGGEVILGGAPAGAFGQDPARQTVTVSDDWLTGSVQINGH
jgi:general secretion pathway protein H